MRSVEVAGPNGPVDARLYCPPQGSSAMLLWLHGGSFTGGDLDMPEAHHVAAALADRGVTVLSSDYRKAGGDVTYPVPADDVLAAWASVSHDPAALGVPAGPVHLGGASAGAALAAGLALRLRDSRARPPASLVLVYPTLHADLPTPQPETAAALAEPTHHDPRTAAEVRRMHERFAGSHIDDPHATPGLDRGTGLPRTLILGAQYDGLRPSAEAFAATLRESGSTVRYVVEHGTRHGYLNRPEEVGAHRSIERIAEWILRM